MTVATVLRIIGRAVVAVAILDVIAVLFVVLVRLLDALDPPRSA